ncbi:PilZ domain protein [Mariprofundus micogutta]|uniref:PilZ domain protein n=1 Tax=Mariprofundus micogutta TaxID=1921010 RepID=A0A1L8CNE2_9PROT|nr:PilZ domain-containing protein [Mariprofundus micogutta]GAV20435.1 PilZ domain protein [Mariprofundus micogutta]
MSEKYHEDQRAFERHPIDFAVDVNAGGDQAEEFCDKTLLKNISGGGVCFCTQQPELYCAGQHIALKVHLPGTDELEPSMECQARVVWIHHTDSLDDEACKHALIGVCLDGFMSFESHHFQDRGNSA